MSKPLVPEIRFGGYSEPWKSDILDNIVNRKGVSSSDANLPRVEYEDIDNVNNLINKDINQKQSSKKGLLFDPNDILFGKLRPYLRNHILPDFKGIAVGDFWIFDPKDNDSQFIFRLAFSKDFEYVANMSAGSKMPRADWNLVSSTSFQIPTETAEQKEIGEWFKRLDDMIANAEKEVTRLDKMKIASLQKMFPCPGQTTPEIRFGGFTEPWIEKRFSDVYMPLKNNTLSRDCLNDNNGIAQNIHYGDVLIKYKSIVNVSTDKVPFVNGDIQLEMSKSNLLINGDVVFADTAEDETVGKCTEISGVGDYAVVSGLHTIPVRPKFEFAPFYLGYFHNSESYHAQLLPLMQGVKVLSVSKSAIADTLIYYPTSVYEQKLIGEYFNNLDCIIEAKRDRIVKLRNIKKACLEKMFVNNTTEQ